MMKVLVIGATHPVGSKVVDLLLAHGHAVVAFGRNVLERMSLVRERLTLFRGALFSGEDIRRAARGCDAVIAVIGGDAEGDDKARSLGMKKIVHVLEAYGPRRIIALGTKGILQADEQSYLFDAPDFPAGRKAAALEYRQAFLYLKASRLDWTIFCPDRVIPGPDTGGCRLQRDFPAAGRTDVSDGELAACIVAELHHPAFLLARVGIAGGSDNPTVRSLDPAEPTGQIPDSDVSDNKDL
jgi:putative NADH-flavin reductase